MGRRCPTSDSTTCGTAHATLLLTAGIHPKIVSDRLGHANVSITLDVYSHAVPTLQREAASQVADLIFGPS